ncbi:hypothetical protein EWH99_02675 [Sporolactobacillus sp. THM7-7]|nr:hypothetical protein EWH99_02675 [Sporolactobacillus sp. THM7-7]
MGRWRRFRENKAKRSELCIRERELELQLLSAKNELNRWRREQAEKTNRLEKNAQRLGDIERRLSEYFQGAKA